MYFEYKRLFDRHATLLILPTVYESDTIVGIEHCLTTVHAPLRIDPVYCDMQDLPHSREVFSCWPPEKAAQGETEMKMMAYRTAHLQASQPP